MFIAFQGNFLPLTFTFTSRKEKKPILIQSPVRELYTGRYGTSQAQKNLTTQDKKSLQVLLAAQFQGSVGFCQSSAVLSSVV